MATKAFWLLLLEGRLSAASGHLSHPRNPQVALLQQLEKLKPSYPQWPSGLPQLCQLQPNLPRSKQLVLQQLLALWKLVVEFPSTPPRLVSLLLRPSLPLS